MPTNVTVPPTGKPRVTSAGCAGCLGILMALPFLAFAISFGRQSLAQMAQGRTSQAMPLAAMALVIGLSVVFFIFVPILRARRAFKELDTRKAAAPDQPWLWRADWASRQVVGSYSRKLGARWLLALVWNAIALPGSYVVVKQALATGDKSQFLVLAFPVIGLSLLGTVVHATLRASRYGRTVLELSTLPGTIGGKLEGKIRVGRVLEPANGVQVELACVRRYTSGVRYQSTRDTTLWHHSQQTPAVTREAEGVAIPFAFSVPDDAVPTGDRNSQGTVYWRVSARAEVPGADYAATFEVPVFRAAGGDRPLPAPMPNEA